MSSECTDPTHSNKDGPWLSSVNPHLGQSNWLVRRWAGTPAGTMGCGEVIAGASEKNTLSLSFLQGLTWRCEVWNGLQTLPWGGESGAGGGKVNNWHWGALRMKPNHGRQSKEMERVQVLVNHSRHWIKPHLRPALTSGFSVTLAKSSLLCLSQLE